MKNKDIKIAPSLLSCDFSKLEYEVHKCVSSKSDMLHIDVMDGHFVPNITLGPLIVNAIRPHCSIPIDCHLMVENPDAYIPQFAKSGADMISVHTEVLPHLHRTIALIKEHNCKAGIVLNPLTPLEYAFEAAEYVDYILLMSVNPGFGGQKFIKSALKKIEKLRAFLDSDEKYANIGLQVDGGIVLGNLAEVVKAGADIIISGTGLFYGDFDTNIKEFRRVIKETI